MVTMLVQRLDPFHYLLEMEKHVKSAEEQNEPVIEHALREIPLFILSGITCCFLGEGTMEIIPLKATSRLPWAKSWLSGITYHANKLFPVIDLREYIKEIVSMSFINLSVERDPCMLCFQNENARWIMILDKFMGFKTLSSDERSVIGNSDDSLTLFKPIKINGEDGVMINAKVVESFIS